MNFSLVENAFATRQLAVLATRIAFKTFWPRHAEKSKFFSLSFYSFGFLFAAVIGLLPGLLEVKKCLRKSH